MLRFNRKKIIIYSVYASFFIIIPLIKNETRSIEKKIQSHKSQILFLEKNLLEANLEFHYLTSPAVLFSKTEKNLDNSYISLDLSQIYLSFDDFKAEQRKITKNLTNEK